MKPSAAIAIVAGAAGFLLLGFLWGAATREAAGGATSTDYADGVLTVRFNAYKALGDGLRGVL